MWNLQFHLAFAACLRSHHLKIRLKSLLLRQTERLGGIEMPKYRYMFFRIPANWSWKFLTTQMPISFQIKVPQVHLLLFLRQLKTWVFSAWGLASMSVLILNTPNPDHRLPHPPLWAVWHAASANDSFFQKRPERQDCSPRQREHWELGPATLEVNALPFRKTKHGVSFSDNLCITGFWYKQPLWETGSFLT